MADFNLNYFRDVLGSSQFSPREFQPRVDFSKMPTLSDDIFRLSQIQQNAAQAQSSMMQARLQAEQQREKQEAEEAMRKADAAAYGQPAFGGQPMFPIDRGPANPMGGATGGTGSTGQAAGRPSSGAEETHPDDAPWHALIQQARAALPVYAGKPGGHTAVAALQKQIMDAQAKMDENKRNRATVAETRYGHEITRSGNEMTNSREALKYLPNEMLRDPSFQERMGAANPMYRLAPEQWEQIAAEKDKVTQTPIGNGATLVQTGRGYTGIAQPNTAADLSLFAAKRQIEAATPLVTPQQTAPKITNVVDENGNKVGTVEVGYEGGRRYVVGPDGQPDFGFTMKPGWSLQDPAMGVREQTMGDKQTKEGKRDYREYLKETEVKNFHTVARYHRLLSSAKDDNTLIDSAITYVKPKLSDPTSAVMVGEIAKLQGLESTPGAVDAFLNRLRGNPSLLSPQLRAILVKGVVDQMKSEAESFDQYNESERMAREEMGEDWQPPKHVRQWMDSIRNTEVQIDRKSGRVRIVTKPVSGAAPQTLEPPTASGSAQIKFPED